ncbi:MAG TPA: preprotein translocase subunit SecG [Candidatus Gemmiger avicola]|uniref:Protein-export membrane protein SecG n=1 Tax=Candidatus Gemmiger avicola TaxID=2838605 RepID=A0A9D2M853_9FIRM|nr:preprotein translocase subunit SecG [Candidatus Gemmiger avicola]
MEIYEIIVGVVLIIACLLIIVFTLAQEQKGQGLSAAIMGDNSFMAAGRERGLDAKLAKLTRVLGVVFMVAALVVSVVNSRL